MDALDRRVQVAFGEVVRALRSATGLSPQALSEAAGQNLDYLSLVEAGRVAPSVATLWTLARLLGVPASTLIEQVEAHLDEAPRGTTDD